MTETELSYDRHLNAARKRIHDRACLCEALDAKRQEQARRDVQVIVEMIVRTCAPLRVYQWGSVLRAVGFKAYSDIDLAVEGVTGAEEFFRLLGEAQALTRFPWISCKSRKSRQSMPMIFGAMGR